VAHRPRRVHSHLTRSHSLVNSRLEVIMDMPSLQRLAPPAVTALVAFLAYSSQWLFSNIEPGRLRKGDSYLFNLLVACLLICYWMTCFTDPGRIPKDWHERLIHSDSQVSQRQRWCRKCDAYKPPRAHHCKTCKRYALAPSPILQCLELFSKVEQLYSQNGPPLRLDR
jgi:palmitoyltransferase